MSKKSEAKKKVVVGVAPRTQLVPPDQVDAPGSIVDAPEPIVDAGSESEFAGVAEDAVKLAEVLTPPVEKKDPLALLRGPLFKKPVAPPLAKKSAPLPRSAATNVSEPPPAPVPRNGDVVMTVHGVIIRQS